MIARVLALLLVSLSTSSCAEGSSGISRVTTVEDIVYARGGELSLEADVYVPAASGPAPAVLVVHGGSWVRGTRRRTGHIAKRLAEAGYLAVNIEYRLAPEYTFPAPLQDCKDAIRWMRSNAQRFHIDPTRIGAFGYSAGGHLVALLATTRAEDGLDGDVSVDSPSARIQAAVIGGAPIDLRKLPPNPFVQSFLGNRRDQTAYTAASPISYVGPDDPPIFIYHGKLDVVVSETQARAFAEALARAGVPKSASRLPSGTREPCCLLPRCWSAPSPSWIAGSAEGQRATRHHGHPIIWFGIRVVAYGQLARLVQERAGLLPVGVGVRDASALFDLLEGDVVAIERLGDVLHHCTSQDHILVAPIARRILGCYAKVFVGDVEASDDGHTAIRLAVHDLHLFVATAVQLVRLGVGL